MSNEEREQINKLLKNLRLQYKELEEEIEELKLLSRNNFVVSSPREDMGGYLTSISGYDAGETQTLKNVNGVFTWVTD